MVKIITELLSRIKTNFQCDLALIFCKRVSMISKIEFIIDKYIAIILNKRSIKYLGKRFYYDNRFAPALLEPYPKEIQVIDQIINLNSINSVLDVGANIGQWSYTMKHLFPKLEINSFEPNKKIFPILKKNARINGWQVFNFALGDKKGKIKFFYTDEASQEGSFYKENMNQNYIRKNVKSMDVDVERLNKTTCKKLNISTSVDLVKIDVEGAEIEVLKALKDIKFKYLYIEVSINRKSKGNLKEIIKTINEVWRVTPKILYFSAKRNSPCGTAILRL